MTSVVGREERVKIMEGIQRAFHWDTNPFSFTIRPDLFVGYGQEVDTLVQGIQHGNKFALLLGPTGSGKTTLLKYIALKFPRQHLIYLPKPPKNPEDWIGIFHEIVKPGFWARLFHRGNGIDLYNLSDRVNSRLTNQKCLLFVDECHEATQESLEWLRTITDQVENLTVVLAGLPVFENMLKDKLETFLRRVTLRIDLGCLSPVEMQEFIKKRIESVGGENTRPFTHQLLEQIHHQTGGFPRDVLKMCNDLTLRALQKGVTTIDTKFLEETELPTRVSRDNLEVLPSRQKLIMDTIIKEGELTPTEIVLKIQAKGDYKDRENAIRSVNNLVRRLQSDGFLERKRIGKAYKYRISPRYRTLFVEA